LARMHADAGHFDLAGKGPLKWRIAQQAIVTRY
jgi:hypothetical protein